MWTAGRPSDRVDDGGNCHQENSTSREVHEELGAVMKKIINAPDRQPWWPSNLLPSKHGRYGKMPEMFPGRVGAVVQETYCETVFQECRFPNLFRPNKYFSFRKACFWGVLLSFFNVQCLSDTIPSIVLPCLDKAPLLYCPRSNPIKLNNGACLGFYFVETFWFPWEINLLCRNQS